MTPNPASRCVNKGCLISMILKIRVVKIVPYSISSNAVLQLVSSQLVLLLLQENLCHLMEIRRRLSELLALFRYFANLGSSLL
mmetsp:Transcript_10469/g.14442  ORF Transcript_10469/g.14442 Transcript_10469/m.14442 type:complete len:83 (-) Transcript_10469:163-411(-)